ncbi:MAG: DUF4388 domain-containing protein [Desulfobacula sp.]|uniref:DUF4388 domain-containing protein n=1 Tax=Desulfobacula sp. TaxID=2593537 RepID=UPI0025C3DE1C|nr:DUF4388 domain-containing protein [Desulfobacula sp.]MCD4719628.1 DUF4388 domain-containing protein [Desulfobacula sp.]
MISDDIRGISGQIAGVNLSSFLQMIEMEQKTCTIKVFTKKNMGQIFFLNGILIDSNTVSLKHLDALYDILSWDNIVIEVGKNTLKKQNVINLPLMHILIESARYSDEIERTNAPNDSKNINSTSAKSITRQILKSKNFCLEIGIKLLIDFDDQAISFRSTLVGIEHGKYLLLKTPGPFGKIDHDLFKVEDLIIKSLYKGTIYAFRSKLMSTISKPSKLMFIEYPLKIEHHELRSHKRFKCSIVTQTEVNKKERGGVIENISIGGCLCVIETFSTDKNLHLLNDTIPFRCHFPGSKGEVSFRGEIKNKKKKSDEIVVGIKFIYLDSTDEIQSIINNYIQLIECSSENV